MPLDPLVSSSQSPLALGFLTVIDQAPHGLIGGYLVVDAAARPIEFHCTAPLRPNRAQEILYGPTLGPYLYGEQIGQTLVRASKLRPLAIFTDCPPALAAAAHLEAPLWLVLPPVNEVAATAAVGTATLRVDAAQPLPPPAGLVMSRVGRNCVARDAGCSAENAARSVATTPASLDVDEQLASILSALDLSEPFERIRTAIGEAQRGGR